MHNEAIRLTNLINDFLDLQRIEARQQTYNFACIDLGALLREIVSVFIREDDKLHALLNDS